jgi:predicted nucleic acid-binding protein
VIERSAVYLDASAVVKLIVDESCSAELAEYLRPRQLRIASRIADVEVRRAITRCGAPIDPERVARVLAALLMVELDASLANAAGRLSPPTLRTLDAIHLAVALELIPDLEAFVTYDHRLAEAAARAGLVVVSPGSGAMLSPTISG